MKNSTQRHSAAEPPSYPPRLLRGGRAGLIVIHKSVRSLVPFTGLAAKRCRPGVHAGLLGSDPPFRAGLNRFAASPVKRGSKLDAVVCNDERGV